MRVLLDANVPRRVGQVFRAGGHEVIDYADVLTPGVNDALVCAAAQANEAIVVSHDRDMRGMSARPRWKELSFFHLLCDEAGAAERVGNLMSLLEHEHHRFAEQGERMRVEIRDRSVISHR